MSTSTYLFAGLEDFGDTLEFTLFNLDPSEGEFREEWLRLYDGFTPAQKHAVRMWLEYVRDEKPWFMVPEKVDSALKKYWGRDWT